MKTHQSENTTMDVTSKAGALLCGYCGCEIGDSDVHAALYALMSEFYHTHDRTWQHVHEYAAKVEALVLANIAGDVPRDCVH